MIYIRLDYEIKMSFFENIKYKIKGFRVDNIDSINRKILSIKNDSDKVLDNIKKYLNENCINKVCISNELLNNRKFMNFIKENSISYYDGKWLFKNLTETILDYIMDIKNERLDYQEVSFITDHIDKTLVYLVECIAPKVKLINIITKNELTFKKLKERLFNEYGIILNFSYNSKSLLKSDVILNFNNQEKEISRFVLPRKCILINFESNILIKSKSFNGINVIGYDIELNNEIREKIKELEDFDNRLIYESLIYRNTLPQNIKQTIENDKIKILYLNGIKGEIKKAEYVKNIKKIPNLLDKTQN